MLKGAFLEAIRNKPRMHACARPGFKVRNKEGMPAFNRRAALQALPFPGNPSNALRSLGLRLPGPLGFVRPPWHRPPPNNAPQQDADGYVVQNTFAVQPQPIPLTAGVTRLSSPDVSAAGQGWDSLQRGTDGGASQPQQQQQPAQAAAAPSVMPMDSSLAFARHMITATNAAQPLGMRLEALSFLLFRMRSLQAAAVTGPVEDPCSWMATVDGLALLEQVYMVGQAIADLGVADSVYAGAAGGIAASNGQRAVAALDFSQVLSRYLQQHGVTLKESFVAGLPYDWMQAKAIHLSSCLETRCTVHRLVFERLIDRVGMEGAASLGSSMAPWGSGGGFPPIAATTITNTTITSAQGGVASSKSESDATAKSAGGQAAGGTLQAIVVAIIAVASGLFRLVVAVVMAVGALLARLLALRTLVSAIKAAGAMNANKTNSSNGMTQPGSGNSGIPSNSAQPQPQPAYVLATPTAGAAMQPAAALAAGAPVSAQPYTSYLGSLGTVANAAPPMSFTTAGAEPAKQQQQQQRFWPLSLFQSQQQQQQQQQKVVPPSGPSYFDVLMPSNKAPPKMPSAAAVATAALEQQRVRVFGSHPLESEDSDGW